MKRPAYLLLAPALTIIAFGCTKSEPPAKTESAPVKAAVDFGALPRPEFNRTAAELFLPLFWVSDANGDNKLDPGELSILWGIGDQPRSHWMKDGKFTEGLEAAYQQVVARTHSGPDESKLTASEKTRRAKVREELDQGLPTVVQNDFSASSAQDKAIVEHVLNAAKIIERIHAKQTGASGLADKIPADDTASQAMFFRNQGPWCVAPKTEADPDCNALADKPARISGLYPADIQKDGFCEALAKRQDADSLMHQFFVVQGSGEDLKAVPYSEAYAEEMKRVSDELKAAAAAITSEDEGPFKTYLEAAAQAFLDNEWQPADEAWSKMNVNNSKWYLRIGPDEVYFEPCSRKAGFHVSFARINQDSLTWQKMLDPVKGDMEKALAELAGKPYKAREVSFHLPDVIDIVLNAGDARSPHGATIGQSLPNWGPVANEGRGRTVAMTNLYTDPDSKAQLKAQAQSLLCADTMATFTDSPKPQVMSTVLHEAAHNLGPAHEYKVKGKTASQIFGGPLASTMEELKAQTAALFFTDWLVSKNLIAPQLAQQAHTRDVVWSFGHISRGMYTADGKPKPYSQLAAIQLGFLEQEGAATWRADEKAANGEDMGCLSLDQAKFKVAAHKLMKTVAGIKGSGDLAGAKKLRADFVDADSRKARLETIRDRWLRAPKASFVYAVDL